MIRALIKHNHTPGKPWDVYTIELAGAPLVGERIEVPPGTLIARTEATSVSTWAEVASTTEVHETLVVRERVWVARGAPEATSDVVLFTYPPPGRR